MDDTGLYFGDIVYFHSSDRKYFLSAHGTLRHGKVTLAEETLSPSDDNPVDEVFTSVIANVLIIFVVHDSSSPRLHSSLSWGKDVEQHPDK
jgi:hypothetical protein